MRPGIRIGELNGGADADGLTDSLRARSTSRESPRDPSPLPTSEN